MNKIHLNRDRQNLGQFTPEDVAAGLRSGRFLPGDLAWREGMETWQPLGTFTDLPAPEESAPPVLDLEPAPIAAPPAGGLSEEAFPWDRRGEIGVFSAFFETLFQSLGHPSTVFRRLAPAPAMVSPYLFYLLLAIGSFTVYSAEILFFMRYSVTVLANSEEFMRNPESARALEMMKNYNGVGLLFLVFLVVPALPFVASGVHHLMLMLFGGAHESFLKTFAVTAYVFGAASPLVMLPCCGPFAFVIWTLIAASLGLAAAHRTDTWRGVLAVLVPFLFCCGGYFMLSLVGTMATTVG